MNSIFFVLIYLLTDELQKQKGLLNVLIIIGKVQINFHYQSNIRLVFQLLAVP